MEGDLVTHHSSRSRHRYGHCTVESLQHFCNARSPFQAAASISRRRLHRLAISRALHNWLMSLECVYRYCCVRTTTLQRFSAMCRKCAILDLSIFSLVILPLFILGICSSLFLYLSTPPLSLSFSFVCPDIKGCFCIDSLCLYVCVYVLAFGNYCRCVMLF